MRLTGKAGDGALRGDTNGLPLQRKPLPPREAQIARVVFKHGKVTAQGICDALDGALSNAAVRSMLQRLIAKGILQRRLNGYRFEYAPAEDVQTDASEALRRVVEEHFDGCFIRAQEELTRLCNQFHKH